MGEVLSFGFNLAVSFPSDSRGSKARIVLYCSVYPGSGPLKDVNPTSYLIVFDVTLFAVCLSRSDELWVYDQVYL